MPKGRGSNKTGGGPTAPRDWQQQLVNLQTRVQIMDSMYRREVAANQGLRGQIQQLTQMLIGAVIATGGTDILVTPDEIAAIADYAGVVPTEDDDQNLILTLIQLEDDDEDLEEE